MNAESELEDITALSENMGAVSEGYKIEVVIQAAMRVAASALISGGFETLEEVETVAKLLAERFVTVVRNYGQADHPS